MATDTASIPPRLEQLRLTLGDALSLQEEVKTALEWKQKTKAPTYILAHAREELEAATREVKAAQAQVEQEERALAEAENTLATAPGRAEAIVRQIRQMEAAWVEALVKISEERGEALALLRELEDLETRYIAAWRLCRPGQQERLLPVSGNPSAVLQQGLRGADLVNRLIEKGKGGYLGDRAFHALMGD